MAEYSNIQKIGQEERNAFKKRDYDKKNPYSPRHKDALSGDDEKGKGTGKSYIHTTPNHKNGIGGITHQLDTENGGGKYDLEGYDKNGDGGRNYLENINNFGKGDGKDYSKNDKLWSKKSKLEGPSEEYHLPNIENGSLMKPVVNVIDGGNELDKEIRERNIGINKFSKANEYRGNILRPKIDGEVGWN